VTGPRRCRACGFTNRADVLFCEECGTPLLVDPTDAPAGVCPACGHPNAADYRFCAECGEALAVTLAAPTTLEAEPTPEPAEAAVGADVHPTGAAEAQPPAPEEPTVLPGEHAEESGPPALAGIACATCGHPNSGGYRFCEECGASLATAPQALPTDETAPCPACGFSNRPGLRFCEDCGASLATAPAEIPVARSAAAVTSHPTPAPTPRRPPVRVPAATTPPPTRRRRRRWPVALAALVLAGAGVAAAAAAGVFQGDGPPSAADTTYPANGESTDSPTTPPTTAHAGTTAAGPGASTPGTSTPGITAAGTTTPATSAPETTTGTAAGETPPTIPAEILAQMDPTTDAVTTGPDDQVEASSPGFQLAPNLSPNADNDSDGLSNAMEQALADHLAPVYVFDEEEPYCLNPYTDFAVFWQATPSQTRPPQGDGVPTVTTPAASDLYDQAPYAVVTFVAAYTRDCGAFGIEALVGHPGDTETVYVIAERVSGGGYRPLELRINRHYEPVHSYSWSQLRIWEGAPQAERPYIWVSEAKHASYISADECEKNPIHLSDEQVWNTPWLADALNWLFENPGETLGTLIGGLFGGAQGAAVGGAVGATLPLSCTEWEYGVGLCLEDCGGWEPPLLAYTPFSANVGEINQLWLPDDREAFDDIADSGSGWHRNLFYTERAWYPDHDFCGGQGRAGHCAGSLSSKWVRSVAWFPDTPPPPEELTAHIDRSWWTADPTNNSNADGITLHLELTIDNYNTAIALPVTAEFYTLDADGDEVPARTYGLNEYHIGSGNLRPLGVTDNAVARATLSSTPWADFRLEVPYSQLFPGTRTYFAYVTVESPDGTVLVRERTPMYRVTLPGALDGRWSSNINGGWSYDFWGDPDDANVYLWVPVGIEESGSYTFTGNGYELRAEWCNAVGGCGSGYAMVTRVDDRGRPNRIDGLTNGQPNGGVMWR
jgi:hypothetical protein